MSASPYCLYCDRRVDPDLAVFVVVDGAVRSDRSRKEASWTCGRPECLERLSRAAEEERCFLLAPQGIFDPMPRDDGLPAWLMWISRARAEEEAAASDLFGAIYRPYTPTAR